MIATPRASYRWQTKLAELGTKHLRAIDVAAFAALITGLSLWVLRLV